MKRQGLISILACLLLSMGSPHSMYGGFGARVIEEGAETASKAAMESAAKSIEKAGMTATKEMTESLAKSMDKAAADIMESSALKDSSAIMKSLESSATKELEAFGKDATAAEAHIAANSDKLVVNMTKDLESKSVDELVASGMKKSDAEIFKQSEKGASEALGESTTRETLTVRPPDAEAFIEKPVQRTTEETAKINKLGDAGMEKFTKMSTEEQTEFLAKNTEKQMEEFSAKADAEAAKTESSNFISSSMKKFPSLEDAKLGLKSGAGKIMGTAEIIGMAVLFMIPSIFESAFLAEEQKNALLMTYSTPIEFGNIVLQMPDSAINVSDPAQMTEFYYYGIPVDAVGSELSKPAIAQYPGVTGPDSNNSVSKSITNGYAKAFSLGTAKTAPAPKRYNLNVDALSTLPIFVSGVSESYEKWGSAAINSAYFEQMLVNLDTGYVFYADGLADNTPAAPLVGSAETKSVESYLSTKMGQLQTQGSSSSYTEYTDTFSSSKASSTSSAITNRFNCGCLQKKQDLSADTIKVCKDSKTCLLVPVLESLAAGLAIGADGQQLFTVDALTKDVAQGALGQVIPIQGYGADYLKFFPNAKPQAISSSNLTTSYGFLDADGVSTSPSDADSKVVGANPDNYAAKGIYVYQCKNTPFVKMLQRQLGTVNDHIYDFIVFFDHELNQVPLMVPLQDPKNYNFPTMQMNPAIEFFSTIIGTTDSQGSFAYLPQLMVIPGPGKPPIAPLYGLQAQNGYLKLNGNAQLLAKLDDIVKTLEKNVDIGAQFSATRDALVSLALQGPFTKYSLSPVDATMTPLIGGQKMPVYKGFNAYPLPQTEDHAIYSDILIPMVGSSTAVLPSEKVTKYYGMVTDITYAIDASGSISMDIPVLDKATGKQTVDAAGNAQFSKGYASSCIAPKLDNTGKIIGWTIDATKASVYTWVNNLTKMNGGSPLPKALTDYITAARAAWLNWVGDANLNPEQHAQINGITWQGSSPSKVLKIIDKQALTSNLYVYTCSPVPSKLAQDFFVLTNSKNPAVTDPSLGTMSASVATATTNMLSLISGILYDATGTPVKNSLGVNYQVDPMTLTNSLWKSNTKGFSDNAMTIISAAFDSYKKAAVGFVYPFNFYTYKLGMYQADIDTACYVYADASGAGTSTNFTPQDYFVTYDDTNGVSLNQQLSGDTTQCIVSLVSGVVYNKNGAVHTLSDASLASLYTSVSKLLRKDLKADIDGAKTTFATIKKANSATDKADAATAIGVAGITWKQADVAAKIAAIASKPYVPAPYVMLKYEPTSKQYVQVSPASTDGTDYMYTFFDVPYSDGAGNTIHVGGMFDSKGNQLYLFGDLQLESALIQNGICIDAAGNQVLGVPSLQPIMLLDKADYSLKPGVTGKSMIHADSQDFPTLSTITSPVTVGKSSFYFYYNTIMQAYYVMEVNGKDVRYVSMAGGNVYNQDGSLRPVSNPVALRNGTDVTDIFLPYLNQNGYTQAVMVNSLNKNLYQNFVNVESSFDGNVKLNSAPVASNILSVMGTQVTVVQSPRLGTIPPMPDIHDATQYNVYWDTSNPSIYTVDTSYSWQALSLLPVAIDKDRSLMSSMPAQSMRNAGVVLKNGVVDRLVFANNLYAGPLSAMKQVGNPTAPTVKLTLKKDPKTYVKDLITGKDDQSTGISYYEIVTSNGTYNYSLIFDQLSDDQLTSYQYNAWKSETVADVKGSIILAQFLPSSASGSLQLDKVGIASVGNPPSDASAQDALNTKALPRVKRDAAHGRFVVQVFATDSANIKNEENKDKQSTYLSQDGYVDLETGALFDTKGVPRGIALTMTDLNSLTTKLTVTVSRPSIVDKDGKAVLNKMGKPVASKDATLVYKAPFVPRVARLAASSTSTPTTAKASAQAGVLGRLSSSLDAEPEQVNEVKKQTPLLSEDPIVLELKNRLESLGSSPEEEALKSEIQADLKKFELYRAKSELNKLRLLNDKFEEIEQKQAEKFKKSSMQPKEGVTHPQVPVKQDTGDSKLVEPVVVPALTQTQELQNQLAQLHSRKADVDLQKQVNKLKSSLPKTDEEQLERLEKHNQQLQSAIDVLTKDIAQTSKGKQNDYVKGLLKNKRDTITKHQTLINNNSVKIDALRHQAVANSSTSQDHAGVLGRLGSHETEKTSNGFFSWVNSLWTQVGSLLVGN